MLKPSNSVLHSEDLERWIIGYEFFFFQFEYHKQHCIEIHLS